MNGSGRRMTTQTDYEVLEAQQQLYPAQITLAQIRQDRLL
jgi:outer membrane protein TolC